VLFLHAEQGQLPSASPHGAGAAEHLGAPLLNSLQFVDAFP